MSSQVDSISEKINKKQFWKKTGNLISMQPKKKSSEQPGSSKEEEYERLMMEMKILFQEKYEEVDSLSDEIKKQKMLQEELRGEVEEKVRELSEVQKEFSGYQDKVKALFNSKFEMDEDRLRSLVQDLNMSECESLKEFERLKKIGGLVVLEDKAEMEDDELLRATTRGGGGGGDIEMKKLLDALILVLQFQMRSFEDVFSQKSEMEKVLDITLKESQVMESKIRELELNSASILEKKLKQTEEIEKPIAEKTEIRSTTSEDYTLMSSSNNVSLQGSSSSSLEGSVKSVEEEEEMITDLHNNKDAEKFRTAISSTLQKENEKLPSKVAEIGKSYDEALKNAEMMQRKLDFVIEEREEKEMLMNERDLARDKEIEELRKEINDHKADGDEMIEGFQYLMDKLETLDSVKEENEKLKKENEKLKKDSDWALDMLRDNATTLNLMDMIRARLQQELKTCIQEIEELRKELKSQRASFENVSLERDDDVQ